MKPDESQVKSIPFKLASQMDFDLDPTTRRTIKAVAASTAEAHIFLKQFENAYEELKLTGKTTLSLEPTKP